MKKQLQNVLSFAAFVAVMVFCGIGVRHVYENTVNQPPRITVTTENDPAKDAGWQLKEPSEASEFITGPLVADVGRLCVFKLNNPDTRADWVIVPEATCYVDSSGSSLAFASNIPSKYTIIAAIVEEGVPKILTHICEYGLQPEPQPDPGPSPNPDPTPNPPPITTLKDWVTKNVPESGVKQAAALASCYESAAQGIENGSIRTLEAAFSVIRTASQTKIDTEIWSSFLDTLSGKITEKLAGNTDVKTLGTIFGEIAEGLKAVAVSDTGTPAEPELSEPDILPFPQTDFIPACPDPGGEACQPQQPIIQYRRRK